MITAFAFGIVFGIIPCIVWGLLGGDAAFKKQHPQFAWLLHAIHHWQIGLIIMIMGIKTHSLILGWGLGTTMDDMLFHSFEKYFRS